MYPTRIRVGPGARVTSSKLHKLNGGFIKHCAKAIVRTTGQGHVQLLQVGHYLPLM